MLASRPDFFVIQTSQLETLKASHAQVKQTNIFSFKSQTWAEVG